MSIIIPGEQEGGLDISQLPRNLRRMAEREGIEKLYEVLGAQAPTRNEVAAMVQQLTNPVFERAFGAYQETSTSIIAIADVLKAKGLITEEEIDEAEEAVVERIRAQREEQMRAAKQTPNSPALDEARREAEEGQTVERLDEPDTVTLEDEETTKRVLIEG